MARKGQKFQSYTEELKMEAVRLHREEKWTYQRIAEHLKLTDKERVKVWMRKYREKGEYGLLDQRGRRSEYQDQDRYVNQLKRENTLLKKCLEIWMREVRSRNTTSYKMQQASSRSVSYVED